MCLKNNRLHKQAKVVCDERPRYFGKRGQGQGWRIKQNQFGYKNSGVKSIKPDDIDLIGFYKIGEAGR
jgi:hypothetical protein